MKFASDNHNIISPCWCFWKLLIYSSCCFSITSLFSALFEISTGQFTKFSHPFNVSFVMFDQLQGLWSGGQQTASQSYLSERVDPSLRASITTNINSYAVFGFACGPIAGFFLSNFQVTLFGSFVISPLNAPGTFLFLN